MADRHYRCQFTIPHDSGLPADAVVNTWHYTADDSADDNTNAASFDVCLDTFYGAWAESYGSTDYDWAAATGKHYVFEDPRPRVPFKESTYSISNPSGGFNDWPSEVCITMSMQAAKESGRNMRRRRGRVFLGPLGFGAGDAPMISNTLAGIITSAADTAFFGVTPVVLCVYSVSTHHGVPIGGNIADYPDEIPSALPLSFHPVETIWCDNAWDTQRRRGRQPSYRSTVTK